MRRETLCATNRGSGDGHAQLATAAGCCWDTTRGGSNLHTLGFHWIAQHRTATALAFGPLPGTPTCAGVGVCAGQRLAWRWRRRREVPPVLRHKQGATLRRNIRYGSGTCGRPESVTGCHMQSSPVTPWFEP